MLLIVSLGLVCHGLARAESPQPVVLAQAEADTETVLDSDGVPDGTSPTAKRKLDRHTKIELMFILVILVAVGLGLIVFTWLTARMTRRYMKPSEKRAARPVDPVFTDDWASKPLTEQERVKLDSGEW
jgi:hypothetical protein